MFDGRGKHKTPIGVSMAVREKLGPFWQMVPTEAVVAFEAIEKEYARLLDENRRLANNNRLLNYQLEKMRLAKRRPAL